MLIKTISTIKDLESKDRVGGMGSIRQYSRICLVLIQHAIYLFFRIVICPFRSAHANSSRHQKSFMQRSIDDDNCLITVVIPSYNEEKSIRNAVRSALFGIPEPVLHCCLNAY